MQNKNKAETQNKGKHKKYSKERVHTKEKQVHKDRQKNGESSQSVEMVMDDAQLLQRKVFPYICLATSKHYNTFSILLCSTLQVHIFIYTLSTVC
jgi:hypothetical protein